MAAGRADARSHTRRASVHGGGLRGGCSHPAAPRRPGAYQPHWRAEARTCLTHRPAPRNALLAAFLTQDDAIKREDRQ
jgi:hypothetical protein